MPGITIKYDTWRTNMTGAY